MRLPLKDQKKKKKLKLCVCDGHPTDPPPGKKNQNKFSGKVMLVAAIGPPLIRIKKQKFIVAVVRPLQ